MPLSIFLFLELFPINITSMTSRVRGLPLFKFVVLKIAAFFQTVSYGVIQKYSCARMRYGSDSIGVIGQLGSPC